MKWESVMGVRSLLLLAPGLRCFFGAGKGEGFFNVSDWEKIKLKIKQVRNKNQKIYIFRE